MPFDVNERAHVTLLVREIVDGLQKLEDVRAQAKRLAKIVARNGVDLSASPALPTGFVLTSPQLHAAIAILSALNAILDQNINATVQNQIDDVLLNIGKIVGTG